MLTNKSVAFTTGLLILLFLVEFCKLSIIYICFNVYNKNLLFIIIHKIYQYKIAIFFLIIYIYQLNTIFFKYFNSITTLLVFLFFQNPQKKNKDKYAIT